MTSRHVLKQYHTHHAVIVCVIAYSMSAMTFTLRKSIFNVLLFYLLLW